MAASQDFLNLISDQLSEFDGAETKRMFGGIGLFKESKMFGMITSEDKLYLKADKETISEFEAKGLKQHYMPKKKKGMPYWEAPPEVFEDKMAMKEWAGKAYGAAMRAKKK